MRIHRLIGAAIAAACCCTTPALAQIPSGFTTAPPLPVNGHLFGVYVPMSSNAVGAAVQLRQSFFPGVDFGFLGGLSRFDRSAGNRTVLRAGVDVKVAVVTASELQPLDLSLGGALGILNGDDYSEVVLGPTGTVSRTFRKGAAGEATPYASLALAFTTINLPLGDQTDFLVPLRVGGELALSPAAKLLAEVEFRLGQEFGDDVGFTVGVNMPF